MKKISWTLLLTAFFGTSVFAQGEPPASCHDITECSQLIYLTSLQILKSVNRLPEFIEAWIAEDTSDKSFTPTLQENFTQYMNYTLANDELQLNSQKRFMQDYFKIVPSYVNQLTFTTLLGAPFYATDKNGRPIDTSQDSFDYIKNASGINVGHMVPSDAWRGTSTAKARYQEYYKTISAVQSFNTYLLSSTYANAQNQLNLTNKQKELLMLASDSKWFVKVASENIGVVLRQILLFNSQSYVLSLKMLDLQKQQLAAQSITNTLLILGNQFTEKDLYEDATGNKPGSGQVPTEL